MAANEPVIIKKIKKGGHGHHGGAWKVAYADFVTAMMAFFLLLWLLSSTSKEQKEGIAEYFTPTSGLKDSKGIGFNGGLSQNEKGASKNTLTKPGIVIGQIPQGTAPKEPTPKVLEKPLDESKGMPVEGAETENDEPFDKQEDSGSKGSDQDNEAFKKVEQDVMNAIEQTPELKDLKNNIIITQTPEGLRIDIVDDQNRPMFAPGSAVMTDIGKLILNTVGAVVSKTENKVALAGHTDASQYVGKAGYSNWELSSDRANASRRLLMQNTLEPERIARVAGMADKELLVKGEPDSPRNRRISLTLLRNSHIKSAKPAPSSRGLLSVPDVDPSQIGNPKKPK